MEKSTDMTEESLFPDFNTLSISEENSLSPQGDLSAPSASGIELSYPERITPTQHTLLPEHPHASSISSVQGLLPDECSYDQSFSSTHNNLPTEQHCANTMPYALNDSSGEMETLDLCQPPDLCAGSAESLAHGETQRNKTDNKIPTIVFLKSKSPRLSTIQTANGPVFYLPASNLAAQSPIPPIPESTLRELYEERDRLLQDKDLARKLMMGQRFFQQIMKANSSLN